eukprot:8387104-Pyramimonas_sp.AAC.1
MSSASTLQGRIGQSSESASTSWGAVAASNLRGRAATCSVQTRAWSNGRTLPAPVSAATSACQGGPQHARHRGKDSKIAPRRTQSAAQR